MNLERNSDESRFADIQHDIGINNELEPKFRNMVELQGKISVTSTTETRPPFGTVGLHRAHGARS